MPAVSGREALSYTHAVPDRAYPPEGTRIGVFGGTFDPPHIGHLAAAVNVRHALRLDRVLLVVANDPWQKVDDREISPAAARLELVRAATEGVEGLEASDLEIVRGGPSYSADTLAELGDRWPDASLWLIVGRDAALGFPTWERVDEVAARAHLVVVDRPGGDDGAPLPAPYSWERVEVPRLDVSSTDLRARVADGRPLDYLTPPAVVTGIARLGLYGGSPA
jgi:nicotinate-nucleotide adenylyltransferase